MELPRDPMVYVCMRRKIPIDPMAMPRDPMAMPRDPMCVYLLHFLYPFKKQSKRKSKGKSKSKCASKSTSTSKSKERGAAGDQRNSGSEVAEAREDNR